MNTLQDLITAAAYDTIEKRNRRGWTPAEIKETFDNDVQTSEQNEAPAPIPTGMTDEFHSAWEALMRQLGNVLSVAHSIHSGPTETAETVSLARYRLDNVADLLGVEKTTVSLPKGRLDNIRRAAARCGDPVKSFIDEWLGDL